MSVSGAASEQVVRLSLEGFEVLDKLTGSGAKNVAAMLYTCLLYTSKETFSVYSIIKEYGSKRNRRI